MRILAEQKRFYQNLYKTKDSVEATDSIEAFLNSLNIPKLSEEQRQSCEGRISTEECRTIIETFQNNKSPGNDGLPIEFYKSCWDLISKPFIDCGFLSSECPMLNYLILIGKIYLWSCRRNELLPTINSFIVRINGKYEIEKYIFTKNKNLQKLMDKWTL